MIQRRVTRTAAAEQDLIDIWLYVSEHNPRAADKLLDSLDRRMQLLIDFPFSGPVREDIAPGIRQLVEADYVLLYRVIGDEAEIIRVLHARRNITSETM